MTAGEGIIGIHLDLKYLMPRKGYLLRWVRQLPGWGINTLLLEYEDKFPFSRYPFLRGPEAFTAEELRSFLDAARGAGLRIIPLVQSLSHLEFALAHEQLAHLREMPEIVTQINPSDPEATAFVEELIDEVLAFHQQDELVHIGADETWHLGRNPAYAARCRELGTEVIWAEHVARIARHVLNGGKRPLAWDDALWKHPERVGQLGLPRELVLMSWDYTTRAWDDQGPNQPRVDAYRRAGFDVIGAPCHDWGVLTPMHAENLANGAFWARKAREAGLLGLISTAWACFHTLLPTEKLYSAATARRLVRPQEPVDVAWQEQFLAGEFGAPADGLPTAMEDLGRLWEQPVPECERPLTPIIYGYMDMVLHYGGMSRRKAEGTYPLDWSVVDFRGMYRQKMELLRRLPRELLAGKLDELGGAYERATDRLARLATEATRNADEAELLAFLAVLKSINVRITRRLLLDDGSAADLWDALQCLAPRFDRAIGPFVEAPSLERLRRIWCEPPLSAIEGCLATTAPCGDSGVHGGTEGLRCRT